MVFSKKQCENLRLFHKEIKNVSSSVENYFVSERRKQVNFISPRDHVSFFLLYKMSQYIMFNVCGYFPKISDHLISEDFPNFVQMNITEYFPKIFEHFPKITEDN